jgi:polysaccharide deacetylase 2 family uncharacterized protein YibQ
VAERSSAYELQNSASQKTTRRNFVALLLFSIVIGLGLAGCKDRATSPLSPAEVHEITHKMMRAAGPLGGESGEIDSRLQFDGLHPERVDHLFVSLPAGASDQARAELSTRLIQSLDRIASANYLTRDALASSGALVRLDYRRAGVLTHSIHIVSPMRARAAATPSQGAPGHARLAIILDDLGTDRAAADAIFALPYPLTISVLPDHAHSTDIAEDAHRRGYEVMLHLPMQSVGNETPEAQELRPGMNADEIPLVIDQMMQSVPNAAGVNNHQGSQATADAALMGELMPVLRDWKLFYVDSRTTAATVAYDTAQKDAVRCAFRNVPFLDDVQETGAIRKQLELAIRGALGKGEAIAIGHPHPATLQALREFLPQAEARGVRLVFASELVH